MIMTPFFLIFFLSLVHIESLYAYGRGLCALHLTATTGQKQIGVGGLACSSCRMTRTSSQEGPKEGSIPSFLFNHRSMSQWRLFFFWYRFLSGSNKEKAKGKGNRRRCAGSIGARTGEAGKNDIF
ncbi:hypothetical protein V8C35DRAFT_857 [Trichoderma chlorosporum]